MFSGDLEKLVRESLIFRADSTTTPGYSKGSLATPFSFSPRRTLSLIAVAAAVICCISLMFISTASVGNESGDGNSATTGAAGDSLIGTRWNLKNLSAGSNEVSFDDPSLSTFVEFGTSSFYLYDSCNGISGSYSTASGIISFNEGVTSMMGCDRPAVAAMRDSLLGSGELQFNVAEGILKLSGQDIIVTFVNSGPATLALK